MSEDRPIVDSAETRESLLIRLRDPACDDEAWEEFAALYRPMILRLIRRCGMQREDAEDIAQQVLLSVMRAMETWQKDPAKGRFRGWLTTVTKNAVRNAFSRAPRDRGSGNSELRRLVESTSAESELDRVIESEFMRSIFRESARRVEPEFEPTTWRAFWLTSVDQWDIAQAAEHLSMSRGAVYSARSRVMRRLQEVALQLDREE